MIADDNKRIFISYSNHIGILLTLDKDFHELILTTLYWLQEIHLTSGFLIYVISTTTFEHWFKIDTKNPMQFSIRIMINITIETN